MIHCLSHAEIDKERYDERLARCSAPIWYARSAVLDVASPGWDLLVDDQAGAFMPLTWRERSGIRYLHQPYGLQYLGVFSPQDVDEALTLRFVHAIPAHFRYIDICVGPATCDARTIHAIPCVSQQMLFPPGPNAARASYSKGHVRNLRTTVPGDVEWTDPVPVEEFMHLFQRTTAQRYSGLRARDARIMQGLLELARAGGELQWEAFRRSGRLLAAMAFIVHGGRHMLFKSAVSEEAHSFRAGFHLMDGHLSRHAGSGMLLDMAGSQDPAVARFNRGFGAEDVTYFRLRINRLPLLLRWLKP